MSGAPPILEGKWRPWLVHLCTSDDSTPEKDGISFYANSSIISSGFHCQALVIIMLLRVNLTFHIATTLSKLEISYFLHTDKKS